MSSLEKLDLVCDFIRFLIFPEYHTPCGIERSSVCELKRITGFLRNANESSIPGVIITPWAVKTSLSRHNIQIYRMAGNGSINADAANSISRSSSSFQYSESMNYRPLTSVTNLQLDAPAGTSTSSSTTTSPVSGLLLVSRGYSNMLEFSVPNVPMYVSGSGTNEYAQFNWDGMFKPFESLRILSIYEGYEWPVSVSKLRSVTQSSVTISSSDSFHCLWHDGWRSNGNTRPSIFVSTTNYYETVPEQEAGSLIGYMERSGFIPGEQIFNSSKGMVSLALVMNLVNVNSYRYIKSNEVGFYVNRLESDILNIRKRWSDQQEHLKQWQSESKERQRVNLERELEARSVRFLDLDRGPGRGL